MPSLLNSIVRWWGKLRHTRGFGVHSPFAYRFITETLRQEHAYYSYKTLRTSQERLVFRIVLALRPASVAVEGMPSARKAVRCAMPSARMTDARHAAMLIVGPGASLAGLDARCSGSAVLPHLLLLGRHPDSVREAWCRAMTCGMTFDNGSDAFVAVTRHDLPRQDFDIRFS